MNSKKVYPTNTEEVERHPEWTMGGNPEAIENQEKEGQEELCNSCCLPIRILKGDRITLENAGVKFGDRFTDPLFQEVNLPTGWKLQPTDHTMWNNLVDEQGRVRAKVFYKAAFYDRAAHMFIEEVE